MPGLVGDHAAGRVVRAEVARSGLTAELHETRETPRSVVLYDPRGRRQAETDLKAVQEGSFPPTGSRRPSPAATWRCSPRSRRPGRC